MFCKVYDRFQLQHRFLFLPMHSLVQAHLTRHQLVSWYICVLRSAVQNVPFKSSLRHITFHTTSFDWAPLKLLQYILCVHVLLHNIYRLKITAIQFRRKIHATSLSILQTFLEMYRSQNLSSTAPWQPFYLLNHCLHTRNVHVQILDKTKASTTISNISTTL